MDRVIESFVSYLETSAQEIYQGIIKTVYNRPLRTVGINDQAEMYRYVERKNMARILKVPREDWELYGEVYIQYEYLSDMLISSKFKVRDQFAIVKYLLEKNLSTHITYEEAQCFNIQQVDHYDFKYFTRDSFLAFVRSDQQGILKQKDESELTLDEKNKLKEFDEFTSANPLEISKIVEQHRIIENHYFKKLDTFTEEDIDLFLGVLREWGLYENILESFKNMLMRDVRKRVRKEDVIVHLPKVEIKEEKMSISSKEYNLLERELRKYFDLRTMQIVEPLDIDKQIYCVSLLLKMGFSDTKIKEILKIINKQGKVVYDNPVTLLIQMYQKINYYMSVPGVMESLEILKEALGEIMMCNDQDYIDWKLIIEEELNNALKLLPKDYEFELSEGRKVNK